MTTRRLKLAALPVLLYLVVSAGLVAALVSHASKWAYWIFYFVFALGFVCLAYLLRRWRGAGDKVARNWLLPAFATCMISVPVESGSPTAGYIVACIGIGAALTGVAFIAISRRD